MKVFFNDLFKLVLISKKLRIDYLYRTCFAEPGQPPIVLAYVQVLPPPITAFNSPYPLMKVKSIIAFSQKISEAGGMAVVPFPFEQAPEFSGATAIHGLTRWPSIFADCTCLQGLVDIL
jgi:hypothetical protein